MEQTGFSATDNEILDKRNNEFQFFPSPFYNQSGHEENGGNSTPTAGNVIIEDGYLHLPQFSDSSTHNILPQEDLNMEQNVYCSNSYLDETSLYITPEQDGRQTNSYSLDKDMHDVDLQCSLPFFQTSSREDVVNSQASEAITVLEQTLPVGMDSPFNNHSGHGENADSSRPMACSVSTDTGYIHLPQCGDASTHSLLCITPQENKQIGFCSDTFSDETSLCITQERDCRQADSSSLGTYDANFQHSPLHSGHRKNHDSPIPGPNSIGIDTDYIHCQQPGDARTYSTSVHFPNNTCNNN